MARAAAGPLALPRPVPRLPSGFPAAFTHAHTAHRPPRRPAPGPPRFPPPPDSWLFATPLSPGGSPGTSGRSSPPALPPPRRPLLACRLCQAALAKVLDPFPVPRVGICTTFTAEEKPLPPELVFTPPSLLPRRYTPPGRRGAGGAEARGLTPIASSRPPLPVRVYPPSRTVFVAVWLLGGEGRGAQYLFSGVGGMKWEALHREKAREGGSPLGLWR